MSSSKPNHQTTRRACLMGAAALLAGCGFEPVYGTNAENGDLTGRINVVPPADVEGRALTRRLERRLGQPTSPDLIFDAEILISEEALGILPDGTISRYNVVGRVDWTLNKDDEVVLSGGQQSFTAYSATSTTVATIVAQRDARERLMVLLADRIVADIYARSGSL